MLRRRAALRGARKLAYQEGMSPLLRSVRLALHPHQEPCQRFLEN
ncbi:MAG TPA: lipoprotein signal peptidase [Marinobacter hydrocarbonoclasticus]|nr:lipoprotein signal peptidase [Marinobacter nauticus]